VTNVAIPAVTAALGVAGGVLLGRNAHPPQRSRKVLGISVPDVKLPDVKLPDVKVDMANVSKQIGEAGRQLGKLAREVQTAREKAEKVSRALS
jgi:hypothetical protein